MTSLKFFHTMPVDEKYNAVIGLKHFFSQLVNICPIEPFIVPHIFLPSLVMIHFKFSYFKLNCKNYFSITLNMSMSVVVPCMLHRENCLFEISKLLLTLRINKSSYDVTDTSVDS